MCGWTTAHSLYILRHNRSRCEYVQVFFTTKKNGLILQSVATGRGELAWRPSGNWGLKEEGETNPQYLVGFKEALDSAAYTYLNSLSGITGKQKVSSFLFARPGSSTQWPTESKQKTHYTERRKAKKKRYRHLRKHLLHALDKSHITGVFAFPSNTVWVQNCPTLPPASSPSSEAILTPHAVENSPGTTFHLFLATDKYSPVFVQKQML